MQRIRVTLKAVEARQSNDMQSVSVQLLSDEHIVVNDDCNRPEWSSTDLYNAVACGEESDWSVFKHRRPFKKRKFRKMLDNFGIKPGKRCNANVFYVADFEDAFKHYLHPF